MIHASDTSCNERKSPSQSGEGSLLPLLCPVEFRLFLHSSRASGRQTFIHCKTYKAQGPGNWPSCQYGQLVHPFGVACFLCRIPFLDVWCCEDLQNTSSWLPPRHDLTLLAFFIQEERLYWHAYGFREKCKQLCVCASRQLDRVPGSHLPLPAHKLAGRCVFPLHSHAKLHTRTLQCKQT